MRFCAVFLTLLACPLAFAQQAPQSAAAGQPNAAVAVAESMISKQDWKSAEAKLAGWVAEHPNDARALFDAGYVADAQNKTNDAAAFYGRAVKADPKSFEAHLSLGLLLARQGKLDQARPELEAATTLDPGDAGSVMKARAWRALAQIDRAKDPGTAADELREALKLTPETPRDTLLAAQLAEETDQPDAAESAYRRVLAADAKNAEARAGLAHLLLAKKQYAEAETLLRQALEDSPDDPTLTAELATALAAQNKAEALPVLEKLHAAHPEDATITRMLAEVMSEAGDLAGSDKLLTELLAKTPNDGELLIAHGQNLIREQRNADAYQVFAKATQLAPSDPDGWSGLAFAASKTGHATMTLNALAARSKLVADNASTYFLWATSYDSLHDRVAAIKYYHEFLEAAAGKFPDQEWQARQRLQVLEKKQ